MSNHKIDGIKIRKKRRAKYGRLYWFPLEADDITRFFLWRVFNKLGIVYIPFTLRSYDEVYLREDISKYSRRLIRACRKWGVVTYVVQEGAVHYCKSPKFCHLPLHADIFLCPADSYKLWVNEGMDKSRIKIYDRQKLDKKDYKGILFIEPFVLWKDAGPEGGMDYFNIRIVNAIDDLIDKDVVFALPEKYSEFFIPLLPPHRIVSGRFEDLIMQHDKIYAFSNSSARRSCEKIGKECEIIDKESHELDGRVVKKAIKKEDCDGVVFLQPLDLHEFHPLTFKHRDHFNTTVMKGIYDMIDKDVLFKPHQAYPELVMPFLPPDRIVWDNAEDLIRRYDKIYTYFNCSIRTDCEMLEKEYVLIGKER